MTQIKVGMDDEKTADAIEKINLTCENGGATMFSDVDEDNSYNSGKIVWFILTSLISNRQPTWWGLYFWIFECTAAECFLFSSKDAHFISRHKYFAYPTILLNNNINVVGIKTNQIINNVIHYLLRFLRMFDF